MKIVATLRDVPMTPVVVVASRDRGVVVVVTVVVVGGGYNCGEDCSSEIGWGEGKSGVRDLQREHRGFSDSGGEGG